MPAVEIDEFLTTHVIGLQCWLLGIRDRSTNKFIKLKVLGEDRTRDNIISYIVENVECDPGVPTRVYTDWFPVYRALEVHGKFIFYFLFYLYL